ncbi:transposase [Phormidium tenue FACHB-886]|nr:transposase [Phormidium tenue FACHB-886]
MIKLLCPISAALRALPQQHFYRTPGRSPKYELIYLMAFENEIHLSKEIQRWLRWYNQERSHQTLSYRAPEVVYWETRLLAKETWVRT